MANKEIETRKYKVFRFHKGDDGVDVFTSTVYDDNEISAITDPAGATDQLEITSIPSPFARMDLIRTAFSEINNNIDIVNGDFSYLDGTTIYHKLVSDCLDIAELFFNYELIKSINQIQILEWDSGISFGEDEIFRISPQSDLGKLLKSKNAKHKLLADTLKLFLEQDRESFNFHLLKKIYFIKYKQRIIGGTSPTTLFFSSSDLRDVDIQFGDHVLFDRNNYFPLYKRDPQFQIYLFLLKKFIPDFHNRFSAFSNYLNINLARIANEDYINPFDSDVETTLYDYISNFSNADDLTQINTLLSNNFVNLEISAGNPVEILGYPLMQKKDGIREEPDSDFIIKPSKDYQGVLPLVLQNNYSKDLYYWDGIWNNHTKVPYYDPLPFEERILPDRMVKYPYVTVSDFLKNDIVKINSHINSASDFICPLTPLFFDFFSTEDLLLNEGKKFYDFEELAGGGIKITLRIPIIKENEFITLDRIYYPNSTAEVEKNKGSIIIPQQSNYNLPLIIKDGLRIPLYSNNIANDNLKILSEKKTDDFFEKLIFQLPYSINQTNFYDGNVRNINNSEKVDKGYILPLKQEIFEYISLNKIRSRFPDNNYFEINRVFNSKKQIENINVNIKIPIQRSDYILFEKNYYLSKKEIIENTIGISIYPLIKIKYAPNFYRICQIDINKDYENKIIVLSENNQIISTTDVIRREKEKAGIISKYYVIEPETDKDFDYLQVSNSFAKGLIIPIFNNVESQGVDKYSFAIDFGTTNTHIEYRINDKPPIAFEILENEVQISHLADAKTFSGPPEILEVPRIELVPTLLGNKFDDRFPQRTIISTFPTINFQNPTFALAHFNIPFSYEKIHIPEDLTKIITNLKWSNYQGSNTNIVQQKADRTLVERFFENLLLLIRNKIIINNGKLGLTEIKWFFPASMIGGRVNTLQNLWNTLFNKYFNTEKTEEKVTKKICESIAPYYYFKSFSVAKGASKPTISIDIGGGTTDVVIFTDYKPKTLTSFRFAANSIFGDGFSIAGNTSNNQNGFILRYKDVIGKILEDNQEKDLVKILEDIKKSEDLITFFFSLEHNNKFLKKELPIIFSELLKNDEVMRIVFLLFYAAIIYHIAQLMKMKEFPLPRFIIFSGLGSNIINYVTPNKETLEDLTKNILAEVYQQSFDNEDLTIIKEDKNLKEVTCKGGLFMDMEYKVDEIRNVLLGDLDCSLSGGKINYRSIDSTVKKAIISNLENFYKVLITIDKKMKLQNSFAIPFKMDAVISNIKNDMLINLEDGLEFIKKEIGDTDEIEETLFFYPLIGALNGLARDIASGDLK